MPKSDVLLVLRWLFLCLALLLAPSTFGAPVINEFLAANESGLADEDGDFPDWIELLNPGPGPVSLAGFFLTDDPADLRKWRVPDTVLDPGRFLVVFASEKDRRNPAAPLHTNFRLSADGEYLALVAPDGVTVVSACAPAYPPQFENQSYGLTQVTPPVWSFFSAATPGTTNVAGNRAGPIIQALERDPPQPTAGPLTIAARLIPVNASVGTAKLYYRRMFAVETVLTMRDDGAGGDLTAQDGIWTAVIPAEAFGPGEMTRWRITATDTQATQTKEPPFRAPVDSEQYFGTVTQDPRIRSLLPVLHWFTSNPSGAGTYGGSRGAVYYDGEFYDNVLFSLHGQSSSGFPKKSYNVDFNRTQRFRWSTNAPRVADIDLLTNWADKSKARHVLAYEVMREAGVAAHFAYTVRIQQNGSFFSTADMVEDADEIYLERAGLNQDGALYKVYDNLLNKDAGNTANTGVEKKTRKSENNGDLQALIDGLDLTGTALKNYLYDHIDIPACVNLLAANSVIRNIDMHAKNWYIYRDTGASGEWAILPWDLDLSHGRVWNQQFEYFDNALYTDGFVVTGTSVRLVSHLFANPEIRSMILRRIRTLSDRFLQPVPVPGTPETDLYYERRLNEMSALIDPPAIVPSDARLDFEKWGSWLQGGATVPYTSTNVAVETMAEAIQRFKTEYLPVRRTYIYDRQVVGRGGEIPLPQTGGGARTNFAPLVATGAAAKALVPANGGLGSTWRGAPAGEPFNTAGWLSGVTGVGYERGTGYGPLIGLNVNNQMRSNNSVYIRMEFNLSDPAAFDRLELRMKYDDGFVAYLNGVLLTSANAPTPPQWNSAALVSREANPNAFAAFDVSDKLSVLRSGRNVLAIQGLNDALSSSDMLIIPELHGGRVVPPSTNEPPIAFGTLDVSPASGNQDEEYIQLLNTNDLAIDISGWQLTGGVEHLFPGGTVIPAYGAIYITPSAAAFRARAVAPKGGQGLLVQGGYQGHLSNLGETLVLRDPSGQTNAVLTYVGQPSDAQRYLVISELMYHPPGDGLSEFIELLNISPSVTLDLAGVRFTQGVEFDFTGSAVTALPPGGRVVVARDLPAFTAVYGSDRPLAGAFTNGTALSNGGEPIKLEDAEDGTIREFTYDDQSPWPVGGDDGYSLVLIAPETNPDHALPANWRASERLGGNPGWPDSPGFPMDPLGDANLNGEKDLIDYALGHDLGLPPLRARLVLEPEGSGGKAALRLIYPVSLRAQEVDVVAVYSTDLVTWQNAAPHLELISRTAAGDGRELLAWRVQSPLNDGRSVFIRLQARLK